MIVENLDREGLAQFQRDLLKPIPPLAPPGGGTSSFDRAFTEMRGVQT